MAGDVSQRLANKCEYVRIYIQNMELFIEYYYVIYVLGYQNIYFMFAWKKNPLV